jgi:hypothetical protein
LPALARAFLESICARVRVTRRKEAASVQCVFQLRWGLENDSRARPLSQPAPLPAPSLPLHASPRGASSSWSAKPKSMSVAPYCPCLSCNRARVRVTRRKEAVSEQCVFQLRRSLRKNIKKKKISPHLFFKRYCVSCLIWMVMDTSSLHHHCLLDIIAHWIQTNITSGTVF